MSKGKHIWGALVIITIWAAVLIVGVVGEGEFVARDPGGEIRVPVVWGVALFALIASVVVAAVAFRDRAEPRKEEAPPAPPEG